MGKHALARDELATCFESLGENCEFGMVQRFLGAEPLGLMRFSAARLPAVTDVIATGGKHLFTESDLNFFYYEPHDEYMIISFHYFDFHTHTFIGSKDGDLRTLRLKRLKGLAFLKDKFFEDMRQANKIYVRRGADSIADLKKLHAALNQYAENTLLCIAEADRDHRAGTVEMIGERHWRGYIRRFKTFNTNTPIDLASWDAILRHVYAAQNPRARFERPRCLAQGRSFSFDPRQATRIDSKPFAALAPLALRLHPPSDHEAQAVVSAKVSFTTDRASVVAFSIRLRIDRCPPGATMMPALDLPILHTEPADLATQGRWQTAWVSARLPAGRHEVALSLEVNAASGAAVTVGGWSVDLAPLPRSAILQSWFDGVGRGVRAMLQRRVGSHSSVKLAGGDALARSAHSLARRSFVEAEDLLATALADAPSDAALLKQYAFCAHNKGDYNRAVDRWTEAMKAAPDDPMCHAGIAANFREGRNLPAAIPVIEKALALFPRDGTVLTEAARIAVAQGRHVEAASLLDRAIALYGPLPELTKPRDEALEQHRRSLEREASP